MLLLSLPSLPSVRPSVLRSNRRNQRVLPCRVGSFGGLLSEGTLPSVPSVPSVPFPPKEPSCASDPPFGRLRREGKGSLAQEGSFGGKGSFFPAVPSLWFLRLLRRTERFLRREREGRAKGGRSELKFYFLKK